MKCKVCEKVFSNEGGLAVHEVSCQKVFVNSDEIRRLYSEEFLSLNQISKKFNVGKSTISYILGESIRSRSEANIIAHKKFPESFKHTESSKKLMSLKRLEYLKNNPEKTAWRTNNISYPEKLFLEKIGSLKWEEKYSIVREFSVFPFYIDFAFVNEMVAVEIDGSQHLQKDRFERDKKKDALLNENGWVVVRITEKEIKKNIEETFEKLEKILLSSSKEIRYEFGILELPKNKSKKVKNVNGFTTEQYESHKRQRKVQRPDFETLKSMIEREGFVSTGKKFGVSDNCIRNWIRFYEKYEKCSE